MPEIFLCGHTQSSVFPHGSLFFCFAGDIRVCSAGALLGFLEVLSRAQMGGGLFFSV
ncbi:MAG: hypothetical protein UC771_07930 [Faecalibacterium sp.]|nr:hypothetical protein [Faecalibacterium sp.]